MLSEGYNVHGLGHGIPQNNIFSQWIQSDICLSTLHQFKVKFDIIIHCGGGSSVINSLEAPYNDYQNTVSTTASILEYIRTECPEAKFIYPSSAAVYGSHPNSRILIGTSKNPVSPYGYHKCMAEELCFYYNKIFNIKTVIIRFFSIYGPGIKKQLLWDAYNKITKANKDYIEFWGTGNETRDWLYIDDATQLIVDVSKKNLDSLTLLNGGSGISHTIKETLQILITAMNVEPQLKFNNIIRAGDPQYYCADISEAFKYGWAPKFDLKTGLNEYIKWVSTNES